MCSRKRAIVQKCFPNLYENGTLFYPRDQCPVEAAIGKADLNTTQCKHESSNRDGLP